MTPLHHKGRNLRVAGYCSFWEYDERLPGITGERMLDSLTVEDADTGEDVTEEFGDDQPVIEAAYQDDAMVRAWKRGGE